MTLRRFITLWTHPDHVPEPVTEDDLEAAERQLNARLPTDYRDAVIEFGLPHPTIALLDMICDREVDIQDVSSFFTPKEIVEHTLDWRDIGLSEEMVAFANDCMGNLFCFLIDPRDSSEQCIFFWNHDDQTIQTVAPSFTSWIESFCSLSPH